MPESVNPYIPGQPVEDPDSFFGRREILTSIREHLVKGRRVSLVAGAARMGKTSLLQQVPHHLPEGFFPVYIDLLELHAERADWLLWRIAAAISQKLKGEVGQDLAPNWEDFEGRRYFLVEEFAPRLRRVLDDVCLLLLIDNVDSLMATGGRDLLDGLLDALASWRDRDAEVALVAAAGLSAQDMLLREYPRLFAGAMAYVLGPLNSEEATRLITWPVDGVLTYDLGVPRRIIEVASGQPYYLQLLCFEIYNRCAPASWVNQRDVEVVVEELVKHEIPEFRQVWEQSSGSEQAVLAALTSLRGARGVATAMEVRTALDKVGAHPERNQVTLALDRLSQRGVLERLGALSYRFRVALLRDWLAERLDLHEVAHNTRWEAVPAMRPSSEPQVSKLTARRRREPTRQPAVEEPETDAQASEPAARRRPWLWAAGATVVAIILIVAFAPGLLAPSPADPASSPAPGTGVVPASASTVEARATREVSATGPTPMLSGQTPQATMSLGATDAATAGPTLTPSPTPPLVVARSVPAIAFQSRATGESVWSLYLMDSNGSNHTLLTAAQSGFLSPPSWSPDGSRIAFVSDQSGNPDIWVIGVDGKDLVNLTQNSAKDHSPAWSHDGEWIAFASLRDALYWELYVMRADGSEVQRLTWWEDASDLSPTWSPDDSLLAFASKRDGNWEIYAMRRDGSNLTRLTNDLADDTNPAWSPDGSRIAFESTRDGYADIFVMPAAGGEAVNVSKAPFSSEHGPTWSPDGGRIAFYSDRDGEWDIYVMGSEGSDPTRLTGDNSNDQVPAWRP